MIAGIRGFVKADFGLDCVCEVYAPFDFVGLLGDVVYCKIKIFEHEVHHFVTGGASRVKFGAVYIEHGGNQGNVAEVTHEVVVLIGAVESCLGEEVVLLGLGKVAY